MSYENRARLLLLGWALVGFGFVFLLLSHLEGSKMGTPLPPNDEATGCALCFGIGAPLEGPQPRYVDLEFIDWVAGDLFQFSTSPLPNTVWRLHHTNVCTWQFYNGTQSIFMTWFVTHCSIGYDDGISDPQIFRSDDPLLCPTEFAPIDDEGPDDQVITGGSFKITWPVGGL